MTDPLTGLWLTVSELARQKGISKQAASKRIKALVAKSLIETRVGARGTKLVNLAQFDKVACDTTDGIRQLNGTLADDRSEQSDEGRRASTLVIEQTRRAAYDADLKKLDLDERLGRLLPIEDVEHSMVRIAETMVRVIDQLPLRADEVANAIAKEGSVGARGILKTIARDLRDHLAKNLQLLSREAEPDEDDGIGSTRESGPRPC
jgi:phage terminase Nu1 subunit (DNA packaging protein)